MFGFLSRRNGGFRKKKINRAQLLSTLENGSYYDAVDAAKELVEHKDYSGMDLMITRMTDHRMAEVLSRIPDEAVIRPIILAISRYAILNLNVRSGDERFYPGCISTIFRSLVFNLEDQVYAYLAEIADYHFFFMKDDQLYYMQGSRHFGVHLDRPDQVALCAKEALEKIPEEQIQAALERDRHHYQYIGGQMHREEVVSLLLSQKNPY